MSEIKMETFLKENVMEVVSKKYKYAPESLKYLRDIKEQLLSVISTVDETIDYMNKIQKVKDQNNGVVYPFDEGDDYWVIEDGKVVWSCWDDISEEYHRDNPNREYFMSEESANQQLKYIQK